MNYNTRIAPSPTGPTHIGTMRTAYFNWLAARASGGKFFVRIDDTDLERSDQKWADQFLKSLEWLDLDWDGLEYQSKRIDIHNSYANELITNGLAARDNDRVFLILPENWRQASIYASPDVWTDSISGDVPIKDDNLGGFESLTLIKSDGSPTYHFASVVDDMDMKINHVIRGVDHITNTAKQVFLYCLFGRRHDLPRYTHIGLIRFDGKKLSKRDPSATFQNYIDQGYDPDAMLNFMVRLGWGPSIDDKTTKILTKDRMVELFLTGGSMKNRDATLDLKMLESYDRKYKGRKSNG